MMIKMIDGTRDISLSAYAHPSAVDDPVLAYSGEHSRKDGCRQCGACQRSSHGGCSSLHSSSRLTLE